MCQIHVSQRMMIFQISVLKYDLLIPRRRDYLIERKNSPLSRVEKVENWSQHSCPREISVP
ncbi:hypothetical protein BDV97DRAFT_48844 [Delphinella strobiligena]|nr:hypothetical protein BDV97DRAFT_48844 [Delphinella strobiligena]